MESPPSFSTHSEVPPISEDSGLLVTSGSFSSDSASGWQYITSELQESDYDERSLSLCEPADTGRMADNFNTVKKGPGKAVLTTIDPPPEFQDNPGPIVQINKPSSLEEPDNEDIFEAKISIEVPIARRLSPLYGRKLKSESLYERRQCLGHRYTSPRLLHLSPCRGTRPSSRSSLTSRLSSSHNSLVTQFQADDSNFITQAISHDTLNVNTSEIPDMYNVPFDSDIYAVPIDMVRPGLLKHKGKKPQRTKKRKSASHSSIVSGKAKDKEKPKRHSLQSSSKRNIYDTDTDSLHTTLREMRKYLHTLYSSSSDSENRTTVSRKSVLTSKVEPITPKAADFNKLKEDKVESNNNHKKPPKNLVVKTTKKKDAKTEDKKVPKKISPVRILSLNLKQSFCNLFRWRRAAASDAGDAADAGGAGDAAAAGEGSRAVVKRALPPLPQSPPPARRLATAKETVSDFATSIQKVKDHGWYWGPISVEASEKILSNEPDGSFIVRDSSDDHYIFTLTFKLNGLRHVRIEHDQGNFCFGGCTMFKAQTIVEFIENAVETSRSGRYLFFLNLRPVLGPVRVQLLYPVSRFKRVQSLQHMCRFVILKLVRRDLIGELPLPRRLVDYLNAAQYYSELLADA